MKQVEISRDAEQRQLRAYVFIGPPRQAPEFGDGTIPIRGLLSLKNGGQTPAYNLTDWSVVVVSGYPRPSASDFTFVDDRLLSPRVLNPQTDMGLVFHQTTPLTTNELTEFKAGSKAIYVYGEIKYMDAFKVPHISRYRLVISKDTIAAGIPWSYATGGNCADEYCDKH